MTHLYSCPAAYDAVVFVLSQEGLENENELQSWFIKRMSKFLTARGKKFIGAWSSLHTWLQDQTHLWL